MRTTKLTVGLVLVTTVTAAAEPTSGVDSALFRSSYDAGGVFAVEGARLAPPGDLSFKALASATPARTACSTMSRRSTWRSA
jgi:hypothetical protein